MALGDVNVRQSAAARNERAARVGGRVAFFHAELLGAGVRGDDVAVLEHRERRHGAVQLRVQLALHLAEKRVRVAVQNDAAAAGGRTRRRRRRRRLLSRHLFFFGVSTAGLCLP